jgi:hypothetical protein
MRGDREALSVVRPKLELCFNATGLLTRIILLIMY